MTDRERFRKICYGELTGEQSHCSIGTYSEKLLHIILKKYYCENTENHEIKVCGSIADILEGNRITEIQTGGFFPLKKKLPKLLDEGYSVTVVYPIAGIKWLSWMDAESGEISEKRKSPKKGSEFQLLTELVYLLPLIGRKNLTFKTVILEIEEYRRLDGWSKDRKKGSSRCERVPFDIIRETDFSSKEDFKYFVPETLTKEFTAKEYSKASRLTLKRSYAALKVLSTLGIIHTCGKRGRENLYSCE